MSQVSHFEFLGLVGTDALDLDLYRFDFDSITLMTGSNDPTAMFQVVWEWLHESGMYPVSHFMLLHWINPYRFKFDSSVSTAVLPLHPALNGKITNRSVLLSRSLLQLQHDNVSLVSHLDFFRLTNVYSFSFESSTSTPGSNDPIQTFRGISGWLHRICTL